MNRKSQEMSLQTIVTIIILLMLLIIIIVFVGSELGGMLEGLGLFGQQANESLAEAGSGLFGNSETEELIEE